MKIRCGDEVYKEKKTPRRDKGQQMHQYYKA